MLSREASLLGLSSTRSALPLDSPVRGNARSFWLTSAVAGRRGLRVDVLRGLAERPRVRAENGAKREQSAALSDITGAGDNDGRRACLL